MIDPVVSLAFTLTSNKGCYALLLGSGISRSAHIPTGWEITLDLIRKVAKLSGEEVGNDPAEWFENKFNSKVNYSSLLGALTNVPSERSRLLSGYFEPTEEERNKKWKLPTKAHHAIAELVAGDYFKVIITTNFDRLLEKAFDKKGLQPKVVSSADAIDGSIPLVHMKRPLILKINGDYLDTRIKNTEQELSHYDPRISKLLTRIFEDFGIITCGWSGTYDKELINLFSNHGNSIFNYFWTDKFPPGEGAKKLIAKKNATFIQRDGDTLFSELARRVIHLDDDDSFTEKTTPEIKLPKKSSLTHKPQKSIKISKFSQPEGAEELRRNRLFVIKSGQEYSSFTGQPKLVLHLAPNSTVQKKNRFKIDKISDILKKVTPIGFDQNSKKMVPIKSSFSAILPNGSIEAINTSLLEDNKFQIDHIENVVLKSLADYFQHFVKLKLKPPVHLLISLVGVKGFEIIPNTKTDWNTGYSIKENEVLCPDIVFKKFPKFTTLEQLRPVFVHIWKSAGFAFGG